MHHPLLAATAAWFSLSTLAFAQAPYLHRVDKVDAETPAELGSNTATLSRNGEHVVFTSRSHELMPSVATPGNELDVYVRDLRDGSLAIANIDNAGQRMGTEGDNPFSPTSADISRNGRFVVFGSPSPTPGLGDTDEMVDIYVRDMQAGATEWVSPNPPGDDVAKRVKYPVISGSGRFVAFLAADATVVAQPPFDIVMLFDRQTGVTRRVFDTTAGGAQPIDTKLALSGDSSTLAFFARKSAGGQSLFTYDIAEDVLTEHPDVGVEAGAAGALAVRHLSIDALGRRVAFQTRLALLPEDDALLPDDDVYVYNTVNGNVQLASTCYSDAPGSSSPVLRTPHISGSGRYVAFAASSTAPTCIGMTTVQSQHVFVADLSTGLITQQSINDLGVPGTLEGEAGGAVLRGNGALSNDGELVVFLSNYKNLASPANPTQFAGNPDGVYLRERQVDGPALAVEGLVAGGVATLTVDDATPDALLFVGYSLTGQGPFPSYWGLVDLSPPVMTFPLMADASGAVAQPLPVPAAMAGTRVWMKALDVTGSAPSTTFMGVVQ